jgi:hypothetical protein
VPAVRLRDLEWGDVRAWPADADGRAQVVRYARAAGLDEQLVLSIAWPMIEEASSGANVVSTPVTALVPSGPQHLAPAAPPAPPGTPWASRQGWATAAAALVLALLTMFGLTWMSATATRAARPEPVPVATADPRPAAAHVVTTSQPERTRRAARPAMQRKGPAKRPQERRPSIFHKELFRIEIR